MLLIQLSLVFLSLYFFNRSSNVTNFSETSLRLNTSCAKHPTATGWAADTPLPVGIENLSNTCFMNAVLQSLNAAKPYQEMVIGSSFKPNSAGQAVKRLFMDISKGNTYLTEATTLIAQALSINIHQQQDSEEFLLQLVNAVDDSVLDGAKPSDALSVRTVQSIRCLNVAYNRSKIQNNIDLSLDINEHESLEDALRTHFKPELLTGAAQYRAAGFGLQDATKSLSILSQTDSNFGGKLDELPDVLVLHLKRFSFDPTTLTMAKTGSSLSIPLSVDLSEFIGPAWDREIADGTVTRSSIGQVERMATGLSEPSSAHDCDESGAPREKQMLSRSGYDLSSVVVHTGRLDAGHYYCFAKLKNGSSSSSAGCGESNWVKLDDHRVSEIDEQRVLELATGGPSLLNPSDSSNAYLLFYTRNSWPSRN